MASRGAEDRSQAADAQVQQLKAELQHQQQQTQQVQVPADKTQVLYQHAVFANIAHISKLEQSMGSLVVLYILHSLHTCQSRLVVACQHLSCVGSSASQFDALPSYV